MKSRQRSVRPVLCGLISAAIATLGLPCAVATDLAATQARLQRLEVSVIRAEDVSAIKKLQRAYGFYADKGLWADLADLFADDGTADYPGGIFVGKSSIREMYVQNLGAGHMGLADGRLYNHTILQPVVTLSPDGATATGRWRVLGMLGRFGGMASWAGGLYRFDYIKQGGVWKIKTLVSYSGYGGRYDVGWALPRAETRMDTSAIRFNLAHPPDRPRNQPCDEDSTVCLVAFPYANPGSAVPSKAQVSAIGRASPGAPTAQDVQARADELLRRAERLSAEHAVLNLQFAYGYYLDRGLWDQVAALFSPEGSLEQGLQGVYVGREHIRQSLQAVGPEGLRAGQLNDHLQVEPIIDVAPDAQSAKGRIFELDLLGDAGARGTIVQAVEENRYVRRDGVWMIDTLHDYTTLVTDYTLGWGKDAQSTSGPSDSLRPDHPPTEMYEVYPKVYTPVFHFDNPVTGKPTQYVTGSRPASSAVEPQSTAHVSPPSQHSVEAEMAEAEREIRSVHDYDEITNLQDAYGYYLDKSQWHDIAKLFAEDGTLEIGNSGMRTGAEEILAFLKASGPEGPTRGALNDQLQLQPVIDVAPDGKTAKIRSRLLQQARGPDGGAVWGGGLYENELVKENGVWKFRKLHLYKMFTVDYTSGWARIASAGGDTSNAGKDEILPSRDTPPFHYLNPVSGN